MPVPPVTVDVIEEVCVEVRVVVGVDVCWFSSCWTDSLLQCDEKVAKTYRQECFSGMDGESVKPRLFENYMALSLQKYSEAYEQAKSIEDVFNTEKNVPCRPM